MRCSLPHSLKLGIRKLSLPAPILTLSPRPGDQKDLQFSFPTVCSSNRDPDCLGVRPGQRRGQDGHQWKVTPSELRTLQPALQEQETHSYRITEFITDRGS